MAAGKLVGKVAIVTGATAGMGEAIAYRFAVEGAQVVLAARREDLGAEHVRRIREEGGEAIFVRTDVTSRDDVKNMVQLALGEYGRIDILVNNVGRHLPKPFEECTPADWRAVLRLNALGALHCLWEVLPIMRKQGSGCVINVSSVSAVRPSTTSAIYSFSKAGLDQLTRCLSNEYARYGIRLNSLRPGLTLTELTRDDPHFYELVPGVPINRYAMASEIAGPAVFLASDDASYVTGTALLVDGGLGE